MKSWGVEDYGGRWSITMIEEIKQRLEKIAYEEWWTYVTTEGDLILNLTPHGFQPSIWFGDMEVTEPQDHFNAEFIAHAPEDIRALLAEIERLQKQNREIELGWAGEIERHQLTRESHNHTQQMRDKLEAANAQLRAEGERLQRELQMLDGRLQVSEYDLQQEQADNAQLRADVERLQNLEGALAELYSKDRGKTNEINILTRENKQLRAALERYERCTHYDSRLQETCNHCHACMHITGHAEDCWWTAALKGQD